MKNLTTIILVALMSMSAFSQVTLDVPATFPTIQTAILSAQNGDTVLVAAGTYFERIDFLGKMITVKGAGAGLTILDGQLQGPVVKVWTSEPLGTSIEDLTVRNGIGQSVQTYFGDIGHTCGGGISVLRLNSAGVGAPPPNFLVRNCIVENCVSSGIAIEFFDSVSIIDSQIINNQFNPPTGFQYDGGSAGIRVYSGFGGVTIDGCVVSGNVGGVGGIDVLASQVTIRDSKVMNNHGADVGGIRITTANPGNLIERCEVIGNVSHSTIGAGVGISFVNAGTVLRDCLIAENSGGYIGGGIAIIGSAFAPFEMVNCTLVGNSATLGGGALYLSMPINAYNCIIRDNPSPTEIAAEPQASPILLDHCNFSANSFLFNTLGGPATNTVTTLNCIDVNPLYVDPANSDYHLSLTSPCIDAGDMTAPWLTNIDIDRDQRVAFANIDIGADEVVDAALAPAAGGRVGLGAGGPFDVLMINGSSGGLARRVTVPVGTASVVTMLQPPTIAGPVQFSIFGLLGQAELSYIYSVPLGIGDMCFAPAPLFPSLQTILFTYASTVGPLNGVVPFLPAYPTPWSSGVGPGIPFPLTLSFQGVIEEAPGVFVPTNLVIYEVQ